MGRSFEGTRWSVARMSQVLTSFLSFQSAFRTSSTEQSVRTTTCSSRRRHYLRLDAADVADDSSEILLGRALREVMPRQPERVHLSPAELRGYGLLSFQTTEMIGLLGRRCQVLSVATPGSCCQVAPPSCVD